jgi:hypothetical protein
MIEDKKIVIKFLNRSVDGIYKILPLYEEKVKGMETGVDTYVDSLLFVLYSLDKAVLLPYGYEYVTVLATLESVRIEIAKENGESEHAVVRREVFKCINMMKNMAEKLGKSESHERTS